MMKAQIYLVSALLLMQVFSVSAQTRQERLIENMVVSAVGQYDAGNFTRASSILRDIIAKAPENDAAHYYLGLSEFCLGNSEEAEKELRTAVSLDSSNFWYRYRLAMVYSTNGKPELTAVMYEDMLRDFPKKTEIYYNLIDLYLSSGRHFRADRDIGGKERIYGSNPL